MGSDCGSSRYDFGADEGQEYRQLYRYLNEGEADLESESGDSQDLSFDEAAEVKEEEELESQAAAALAKSNAEASGQISSGLMHRIASTLSLSTPLKAEAGGASPIMIAAAADDMEMSDEVTSAAADLDRCIQARLPSDRVVRARAPAPRCHIPSICILRRGGAEGTPPQRSEA